MEKLKRLNIDTLIYVWEEDRALFPGLAGLLPEIANGLSAENRSPSMKKP
jgi:hypothetical protein